jgi:hypothetical protein
MICFAGGLAQERFTGAYNADGAERGRFDAYDFASRRCSSHDECEAYLNWMLIRTRNLVNHPMRWEQICALAAALLKQKELSYDDAIAVIRGAIKIFSPATMKRLFSADNSISNAAPGAPL